MSKLLIVNTTLGGSSTGRMALGLAQGAREAGWSVDVAHGERYSEERGIVTERRFGQMMHGLRSLLGDAQGLGSKAATRRLIHYIYRERPDVAHLHNLHGYYINLPMLLGTLADVGARVILTLHDCWPLTGHCAYPGDCTRWQSSCGQCPKIHDYPAALVDRSDRNYQIKRQAFEALGERLTVVPVSRWVEGIARQSFLAPRVIDAIPNGVDLRLFTPAERPPEQLTVLAAASPFDDRKGYSDILALSRLLPPGSRLILAGLSTLQLRRHREEGASRPLMKTTIEAHGRLTQPEMADLYRRASVFVSLARDDNFPTTLLEAQASGIPAVVYDAGGQSEAILPGVTGIAVPPGDLQAAVDAIVSVTGTASPVAIRTHAEENFSRECNISRYLALYTK